MVNWPGVIKFSADAELLHVSNKSAWDDDVDLCQFDYEKEDYLIDSQGKTYALTEKVDGCVEPTLLEEILSHDEVLSLIKSHASLLGHCCVSKLNASSIEGLFDLVASTRNS